VKALELNADPYVWAEIPLDYPAGPYADQAQWAVALGEAYSEGAPDAASVRDRLVQIAGALPISDRVGLYKLLWLRPDPDKRPLLVNVYVLPEDGLEDVTLQELAGAYDTDVVRPPAVDMVDSDVFGSAARVLSYMKDPDPERDRLIMQITIVGRRDGVLVRLDAFTANLGDGMLAVDPITELLERFSTPDPVSATASDGL
jgi:hypothetical protein